MTKNTSQTARTMYNGYNSCRIGVRNNRCQNSNKRFKKHFN